MHIAKFQKQARVVKSFCDALLRLGCVTRTIGEIPLRKNKIVRTLLMRVFYADIFTFPFLGKPMCKNHPHRYDGEIAMTDHQKCGGPKPTP